MKNILNKKYSLQIKQLTGGFIRLTILGILFCLKLYQIILWFIF